MPISILKIGIFLKINLKSGLGGRPGAKKASVARGIGRMLDSMCRQGRAQRDVAASGTMHAPRPPLERQMMTTDTTRESTRAPLVLTGLEELHEREGTELGVSDWVTVDQDKITTFAKLTGDEQWIHVDPERARTGPFGTTIQHGFLTLGMATGLLWSVCVVEGFGHILNYGLNRVRFPSPLRVGDRFRMHVSLPQVKDIPGGAEVVYHLEYEVEGQEKPCCVADLVFRYYS
jgi:acyl dehydratase